MSKTVAMATLSQVRARVEDTERAARFFGVVFGWELRPTRSGTGNEVAVLPCRTAGGGPSAQLVFTDDQHEPSARLGFAVSDLGHAIERVERLGGQIEQRGSSVGRCRDDQGTPLWLHAKGRVGTGRPDREARGVLGVIFVFAERPERAAAFYQGLAGWNFEAIGRDQDILFVKEGPVVGIRPADRAPDGASGAVTFHISVADPEPVIDAIEARNGQVAPPIGAGIFSTQACRDDQGTGFSLWYQPVGVPAT